MTLIKQFNDWSRLNEEIESQAGLTSDQMAAVAAAANDKKIMVPKVRGDGQNSGRPGVKAGLAFTSKIVSKDLGAALFANAQDKIKLDSAEFKGAVELIKNLILNAGLGKQANPTPAQPTSVNTYSLLESSQSAINEAANTVKIGVAGGASAVGNSTGYDNAGLANRRRDNFIAALKTALGDQAQYVTFTPNDPIVGTSTVKDSPEAKAEQKVTITYPYYEYTTTPTNMTTDTDATSVATGPAGRVNLKTAIPGPNPSPEKSKMMIIKIFYKGDKAEFKKKILDGTGSPARELSAGDYGKIGDLTFNQ